jgi:hypothetical protein
MEYGEAYGEKVLISEQTKEYQTLGDRPGDRKGNLLEPMIKPQPKVFF